MNSNQEETNDLFDEQVKKDHKASLQDIKSLLIDSLEHEIKDFEKTTDLEQIEHQTKCKKMLEILKSEMHVSDNGQPDETKD